MIKVKTLSLFLTLTFCLFAFSNIQASDPDTAAVKTEDSNSIENTASAKSEPETDNTTNEDSSTEVEDKPVTESTADDEEEEPDC